mmetsp:Transcript_129/g.164  ORF Transcript_129/g.164 Transcript_129/m.164 type:complete len:170 (+) Transcript_129:490-999(+)
MFKLTAGNCTLIGYRKRVIASIGPQWWCAILTFGIICASWWYILSQLADTSNTVLSASILIQTTLTLCFLHAAIVDPGTLLRDQLPDGPKCSVCNLRQMGSTEHCNDCQVCTRHYDHHCVFFGKCIGRNNIRTFNIFLACLFLQFVLLFATALITMKKRPKVEAGTEIP